MKPTRTEWTRPPRAHHDNPACQWVCALVACAAIVTGCGGEGGRGGVAVEGTIYLDAELLPAGSVVFVPLRETQSHKAAGKIVDGRFLIEARDGPRAGDYQVEVYADTDTTVAWDDPLDFSRNGPVETVPNRIAPEFNVQTVLRATVNAEGRNSFRFEVRPAKS